MEDKFCCAVKSDNEDLIHLIDGAINAMKSDGTPAGFNTAVLAEISKRIGRNFELVSVDGAARASALTSGPVDMVFRVRVPQDDDLIPLNFDRPDGLKVSEHYFVDEIVHVGKK